MSRLFAGWGLVVFAFLAVGGTCLAIDLSVSGKEDAVRMMVRATARAALAFFVLSFTASSLRRLWKSGATRWLLANRRYLGVSYGVTLAIHGLVLAWYANLPGSSFETTFVTMAFGGAAFAFTAAMVATSTDRTAAWLGRARWRRLHLTGAWYNWFIFTVTLVPGALQSMTYGFESAVCIAALAIRVLGRPGRTG